MKIGNKSFLNQPCPGADEAYSDAERLRSSSAYVRWGKRAVDIGASLAGIIVLFPIIATAAGCIRATMGPPILFRQERPGRDGKPFTILKFRTMTAGCGRDGKPLPDGQRLTRLGALLRKTSIDELPQLINVLRGEMSLVGPRPLLVRYMQWYTPRELKRHDVRPGITGWAQINGRNNTEWDERLEQDSWYAENLSLRLDLQILLETALKVVRRDDVHIDATAVLDPLDAVRRNGATIRNPTSS